MKITPRVFSGEENHEGVTEEPGKWLKHFERVCRGNGWEGDVDKIDQLSLCLEGEASDWYEVNEAWLEDDKRTWNDVRTEFLKRFRPSDYEAEIEDKLRDPTQKIGESVLAYSARYKILHAETGPDAMTLDQHRRHWISGLAEELKKDVMAAKPATYKEAVNAAHETEAILNNIRRDAVRRETGKRPEPEKKKGKSIDMVSAEKMVNELARVGQTGQEVDAEGKGLAPSEDPKFREFYHEMSPEIENHDASIDELVERYKAWKFFSSMHSDKAFVKAKILRLMAKEDKTATVTATATVTPKENPTCYTCKEVGHTSRSCPKKGPVRCYVCSEEGHVARHCPKSTLNSEASKPASKEKGKSKEVSASSKKAKISEEKKSKKTKKAKKSRKHVSSDDDDDDSSDDETIPAYMARAKRKQPTEESMNEDAPGSASES